MSENTVGLVGCILIVAIMYVAGICTITYMRAVEDKAPTVAIPNPIRPAVEQKSGPVSIAPHPVDGNESEYIALMIDGQSSQWINYNSNGSKYKKVFFFDDGFDGTLDRVTVVTEGGAIECDVRPNEAQVTSRDVNGIPTDWETWKDWESWYRYVREVAAHGK